MSHDNSAPADERREPHAGHLAESAIETGRNGIFVGEPDPTLNPLGVKGQTGIALCGVAPATADAVWHATARRMRDLPVRVEHRMEP